MRRRSLAGGAATPRFRREQRRTRCSRDFAAALRLRARRLPGRGLPGARGRPRRARRRAHRLGQDDRRRVRRPPRAGSRAASASTPPRSRRCRTRSTPTWSRRYGADKVGLLTGDNTINGEAPVVVMTTEVLRNMLYAGSLDAAGPRLRRDGRGALPRRPLPRRGVGGGDHPPARVGGAGVAVGHGVQRRGVRRLAGDRARRHRRRSSRSAGRCRCTST